MALNQYISVKVCGNPDSNSGFVPILLFNSPSFAVEDQFYVGFDNCSYFYTIKTTKSQTIFKLVKNNVRSYGAARAGSLVIAFSIPKNYKLDGGYTPYDVLGKLKNEFLKMCMTCKDPVRETYEYNSGRIDQHVLDEVSTEFTISPNPSPNREMNPNSPIGYLVRTDSEIEKLFHDINYPEFDNFSEVIVAESVNQTSYTLINNIQIPRPKSYSIYVDGVFKMTCADLNQTLTVSSNSSPEYYENKNVHFTIQNLKDGDILPGIELQEVNERVLISTQGWATPKTRKIELQIVPREFENYFFTNRNLLKVIWPYGIIRLDQDLSFTLEGEQIAEIKKGTIKVSLEQNGKFTLSKYAIYGNELRITIEEIKRQVVQNPQGAGHHRYQQQERVTDLQVINTSPVYDVSILLMGKEKFESSNEIDVKLKTHPEKSNITLATCRTRFKPLSKSNETFEGHFYVSKELHSPYVYLSFQANGENYITKQPLSFCNDKASVEERDFVVYKVKPFYQKRSFLIKLLIPFMAILFGFVIGFALHDGIKSLFGRTKPTPDTTTVNSFYGETGSSMTEDQAFDFLKDADDNLKIKDLKFSKVDELYNKYIEFRDVIEEVDENRFNNKVCDRIEDYSKVVSYVTNRDVEKLRAAMADFDHNDLHIWPQHAEPLKQILKDDPTIERFRNNTITITQFDKIVDAIQDLSLVSEVETGFVCSQCGASFETEAKLNSHKPSHDVATTYTCDKCQETFTSRSKLKTHKEKVHSNPKRFSCSICGPDVYFKTQAELDSHKKSKHER